MADNKELKIILTLFIVLIIGITFADALADSIWFTREATGLTANNESITLNNVTAQQLVENRVTSVLLVVAQINSTGTTANKTLVETDDYTTNLLDTSSRATITLVNASYNGNTSFVSYLYDDDRYIRDNTSRVLIGFIVLFFVLAILLFTIAKVKDIGIMELMGR